MDPMAIHIRTLTRDFSRSQVVVSGQGFTTQVLNLLRQRPEIESVEIQNHHLVIQPHTDPDIPASIGLLLAAMSRFKRSR